MTLVKLIESMMFGTKPNLTIVEGNWIAGGAIRAWFTGNEKTSDTDIFSVNEEKAKEFIKANKLTNLRFSSKTADTYYLNDQKIQMIKIYRDSLESLFDSFDFTLCQFAYDGENIWTTTESIVSVLRNHLAVHKIQKGYELDSLRRSYKYMEKGYKPCLGSIGEIGKSLAQTEVKDIEQQIQISPGGHKRSIIRWD